MSGKPRLLDLFCGAGGCSVGYARAGFEVVGVDVEPQPRYPFEFHQADALDVLAAWDLSEFDALHGSPPCQDYSANMRHLAGEFPRLIEPVRAAFVASGLPWVIENVEGSPLPDQPDLFGRHGVILCGTTFGMRVWRHRWFESSFPIAGRGCAHREHAMNPHNVAGRERMYAEFGKQDLEVIWRKEMGVEWMGRYEGREAIPPAYTEWIGRQLLAHIEAVAA